MTNYVDCYKKAMEIASQDQYVQPTKDGCLILDRAVTNLGWKSFHYADKFVRLDGAVTNIWDNPDGG